jgi:hypothetical protein
MTHASSSRLARGLWASSRRARVLRLGRRRLPDRGLERALPAATLVGLACLEDLSLNAMSGDLAPLPTFAPALRAANLFSILLRGAPPHLPALPALTILDASNNLLSVPLTPDLYAGVLTLRVLDLSTNRLTGPLPSDPQPCATMLRELSLTSNFFTDALPSCFG